MTCPDCHKAYVGQTRRSFLERFNKHKNAFKTNTHKSNYAKHILDKSHSFGPIHNTVQILQSQDKGTHINTIEQYYIYTEFTINNHLNDEHNISPSKIFDALLNHTSHKSQPHSPPLDKTPFPKIPTTDPPPQHRPYLRTKQNPDR